MAAKKKPGSRQPYTSNESASKAEEPAAIYQLGVQNGHVVNGFSQGAAARKPANHMTAMEKLEVVKNGVSKTELEVLKEQAGLDYDTLAQGLSTARATLINIKGKDRFNFAVSEKIVGLEDIYLYGYEVFGDKERFNRWMFRKNTALGDYTPFELINNQFGREEVKSLIGRIDYGVYS
ncbi:MAG TPA: antitoxin Xre/MbcA/ParS toxin-binding domain-containing protein [Chitinophagaceae bacterium]|jgi:putative toxin-antitoxin system antitoxin component (TIGR02293 family)|nr:antitoxin Xre/MbcA/ParS toxin-binding domain-containing protein [Chitinophagaceae bacterium]